MVFFLRTALNNVVRDRAANFQFGLFCSHLQSMR